MLTFLISIVVLVVGYLFYGVFVERIFSPDDRKTPAVSHPDGVNYGSMTPLANVSSITTPDAKTMIITP